MVHGFIAESEQAPLLQRTDATVSDRRSELPPPPPSFQHERFTRFRNPTRSGRRGLNTSINVFKAILFCIFLITVLVLVGWVLWLWFSDAFGDHHHHTHAHGHSPTILSPSSHFLKAQSYNANPNSGADTAGGKHKKKKKKPEKPHWPSVDFEDLLRKDNQVYDPSIIGTYLHITDLHIDPYYLPGSSVGSSCHRFGPYDPDDEQPDQLAGLFGTPNTRCDSPEILIDTMIGFLNRSFANTVDFVIWTGDNSRHDDDDFFPRTGTQVFDGERRLFDKMRSLFINRLNTTPNNDNNKKKVRDQEKQQQHRSVPVVFSLGNNDMKKHNILAKPNKQSTRKYFSQMVDIMGSDFIPTTQIPTFLYGGYYSYAIPDLPTTVISLNTLFFSKDNYKVGGCRAENSPGLGQLAWLRAQLMDARKHGRKVIIIGHHIPNLRNYRPTCLARYIKTVMKFKDIVMAQMFGHSNVDIWNFIGKHSIPFIANLDDDEQWEVDVNEKRGILGSQIATSDYADPEAIDKWEGEWIDEEDDEGNADFNKQEEKDIPDNEYFADIMEQNEMIIEDGTPANKLLVTTIGPSIIPKYQPGFRVVRYRRDLPGNANSIQKNPNTARQQKWWSTRRKPPHDSNLSRGQKIRAKHYAELPLGTLLDYDVYWMDLDKINTIYHGHPHDFGTTATITNGGSNDGDSMSALIAPQRPYESTLDDFQPPDFCRLYRASEAFDIMDLTVDSYLQWAKSILKEKDVRRMFKRYAFMAV
ncbi:Endopolyphosphatase [Mycoemilia scoparia]|uniref:Endopolyphosphatase n=1 Tax=Mycoemilia scoparia TaxID=417184 RepID=A0A9W7ZR11_9FUNG|nr:Endopolyphosphatase [Mycoemilia scoparia]